MSKIVKIFQRISKPTTWSSLPELKKAITCCINVISSKNQKAWDSTCLLCKSKFLILLGHPIRMCIKNYLSLLIASIEFHCCMKISIYRNMLNLAVIKPAMGLRSITFVFFLLIFLFLPSTPSTLAMIPEPNLRYIPSGHGFDSGVLFNIWSSSVKDYLNWNQKEFLMGTE